MQGDGAQQSPGHGACHHTHAETSAHEPEVASPIFPIGDVGDIGASNRTCGAGDAGHDASGVEDRDLLEGRQLGLRGDERADAVERGAGGRDCPQAPPGRAEEARHPAARAL